MAGHRTGDWPLSETMIVRVPTNSCYSDSSRKYLVDVMRRSKGKTNVNNGVQVFAQDTLHAY